MRRDDRLRNRQIKTHTAAGGVEGSFERLTGHTLGFDAQPQARGLIECLALNTDLDGKGATWACTTTAISAVRASRS